MRYLPFFRLRDKSGYVLPKIIHRILVGAHRAKFFSNKIFFLKSVLQIVKFMVLCFLFLKLGILLHCFIVPYEYRLLNTQHISYRKNLCSIVCVGVARITPISNVGSASQACFIHRALTKMLIFFCAQYFHDFAQGRYFLLIFPWFWFFVFLNFLR